MSFLDVRACELLLTGKQRLVALLYLSGRVPVATLLAALDGAPELSLLRLRGASPPSP